MTRRTKAIIAAAAAVAAIGAGSAALASASGHDRGPVDKPDQSEPQGSEVPSGDGPNGHADEPANPNADHQATGAE